MKITFFVNPEIARKKYFIQCSDYNIGWTTKDLWFYSSQEQ